MSKSKPVPRATPPAVIDWSGIQVQRVEYDAGATIFSQGEAANSIMYVARGTVQLSVLSHAGREAVIAVLHDDYFFGEGCLAGQPYRMATASAMVACIIVIVDKPEMVRHLHAHPAFADRFLTHMLTRNIRIEEDLIDQLFNSSEKRLARLLLLLANFGKEGSPQPISPNISQETLAEMIGTTRSRVSFFMNKFRKLGFISYNGKIEVNSSLLNAVLYDKPEIKSEP
jgi:CRP/FNR family transcriptional regulator, cyclic AMP receptor protein